MTLKGKTLTIRLSENQKQWLKEEAKNRDMTVSAILHEFIDGLNPELYKSLDAKVEALMVKIEELKRDMDKK